MRFDDEVITIECACGVLVRVALSDARRSPMVTCPRGHAIQINGADLDGSLKEVERQLRAFEQSLRRLAN
jgi:hypothetical protein